MGGAAITFLPMGATILRSKLQPKMAISSTLGGAAGSFLITGLGLPFAVIAGGVAGYQGWNFPYSPLYLPVGLVAFEQLML